MGILGVGELTEKVVMGVRRSGYTGRILLSPRNRQRAEALAAQWQCEVMASNQAVVDGSALVVLGVRPDAVALLAKDVRLTTQQTLVSLVAGLKLDTLRRLFPQPTAVRAMLSYAAQFNQSTVVVTPAGQAHEALLGGLGTLIAVEHEDAFELATVAACMNGWFYFFISDLQGWFVDQGLSQAQAAQLVLGNLQDCLASARAQPQASLEALGQAIATPGTFTAAGLEVLNEHAMDLPWRRACDEVLTRLREPKETLPCS